MRRQEGIERKVIHRREGEREGVRKEGEREGEKA
jgi:hypothetical protein